MKYLERVILETLRLFPPVPIISRKLNEDVKISKSVRLVPIALQAIVRYEIIDARVINCTETRDINHYYVKVTGNFVLPKDITVVIGQFGVHRLEKYYPNPLVFNPDNFLPEKMQQRHHYAFIPFSAGPR